MKKTIEWYKKRCVANQIYKAGLQYSLVSPDNKQCSPFVYCKDFLQDAVQGHILNEKRNIFRFVYDPKIHHPVSIDETRILVANSGDTEMRHKIPACGDFINQFEEVLKIRPTQIFECENPQPKYANCGVWLFEGSRRWIKSPPMLSLYTLLIRMGFVHTLGTDFKTTMNEIRFNKRKSYQENDRSQLKYAEKGIRKILRFGDRKIFHRDIEKNYPSSVDIDTMHNDCGIVGFSQEDVKTTFPHWYRKITKTAKKKTKAKPRSYIENPIIVLNEVS